MSDDLRSLLVQEFARIESNFSRLGSFNAKGWIEYALWETLEGKIERPFPFFDPLTDEELDVLRLLRDEVGEWVWWEGDVCRTVSIEEWRAHASNVDSGKILKDGHQ